MTDFYVPMKNEVDKYTSKLPLKVNPKSASYVFTLSDEYATGFIVAVKDSSSYVGCNYKSNKVEVFKDKWDAKMFSKYGDDAFEEFNITPIEANPP